MAVAPQHGKGTRVLCDEKDLSDFLREITISADMEPADITTFGDNDKNYLPGLRDGTFSFDGLFGTSNSTAGTEGIAGYLDDAFTGSTKQVLTVDLSRSTGGRAFLMRADQTKYDIAAPVSDVVSIAVDAQASDGYRGGVMLRPLLASTSTGSQTAHLTTGTTAAGGTTSGGVAHLHVTAMTSTATATFKVQHSTSAGSTWADLISFTAASTATFQRSTVAGTVKEHLRSTLSALPSTGSTNTVTAAISFARHGGIT